LRKRVLLAVAIALFVSTLVACSGFFISPGLSNVYINPPTPMVQTSGTAQLAAFGKYADGSNSEISSSKVTWATSDASVATVTSPGGLVTGVSVGMATITATTMTPSSGCRTILSAGASLQLQQICGTPQPISATVNVSVMATPVNNALITTTQGNIESQTTATISAAPETLQFFAYGNGDTSNDITQAVTWTSSNPKVARITSGASGGNGLASALTEGTTNITATVTNGSNGLVVSSQTIVLTVE
jgi:uncharacterized protein YjdB